MNTGYIFEREFYCIDDFGLNEKWFEYFGYTYVKGKYRYVEYHIEAESNVIPDTKYRGGYCQKYF